MRRLTILSDNNIENEFKIIRDYINNECHSYYLKNGLERLLKNIKNIRGYLKAIERMIIIEELDV